MANVKYTKSVSDEHLKTVLQRIADFLKKDITVHSGDRGHVPEGGSRTSLHLQHRAADFHVVGLADDQAFKQLKTAVKNGQARLFDAVDGYEFIYHGPHTETEAAHLHLGHYQGKYSGFVVFKTEGLTQATAGEYTPDPVEIAEGVQPQKSPLPAQSQVVPPKDPASQTRTANAHEIQLEGAVGVGGRNLDSDVTKVQALLNAARRAPVLTHTAGKYYEGLVEDGSCGDKTRHAIRMFQTHVVRMSHPDGRIDPNGRTLRMLLAWSEGKPLPIAAPSKKPVGPKPIATKTKVSKPNTGPQPSQEVRDAILFASYDVGVDYGYMMAMAAQESGFNPTAKAGSTSATGLYQFLDSTWLETLYRHGRNERYAFCGLKAFAERIRVEVKAGKDGKQRVKYVVSGDADEVLDLRLSPMYSALMGAEFAKGNKRHLEAALTTEPKTPYVVQPTELYLAHFLGAGDAKRGATRFLLERRVNGNRSGADLFSDAAEANESVFYKNKDTDKPRTLNEIYKFFEDKIGPKVESYNRTRPPPMC
ncbi:transglycosylase SLT domain-containing protein [Melittangium boletus]|uniref:transglycosylase SLT domain-containing protein n=1 Tax=Melittangium boletus TaxID=83453 RepID=UPI003DA50DA5